MAADHKELITSLHLPDDGLIAILDRESRSKWVFQEPRVPLPVPSAATIILRNAMLGDGECEGLNVVAPLLFIGGPPMAAVPASLPCKTGLPPSSALLLPNGGDSLTDHIVNPIPWPLTYVRDMIPGMTILAGLRGAAIEAAFVKAFPLSTYKRPTVYKHITLYNHAKALNLLEDYNTSLETDGRWRTMVRAVNKRLGKYFASMTSVALMF